MLASGAGIIYQLVQILGNFVYRTVFLLVLSKEYLGINGLFSNVLQLFSLAELGIGSAILFSMHGAFARQETKKIGQLLRFYKNVYLIIGLAVLAIGVLFYPFLDTIVNVSEVPSDVSLFQVYFLFVANSVASYLFIYKQSLLSADQREHLVQLFLSLVTVVTYIARIVVLLITRDYVLVLGAGVVVTVLLNWLFSLWITAKYKSVFQEKSRLSKEEKKQIYKNTAGQMCHKIGAVIVTSTDNIVISKFVSLIAVGLYSNYYTIVGSITRTAISVANGFLPSLVNYTETKSKTDTYQMLKKILFANMWAASFTTVCLFALLNPFITVWLGEDFLMSYAVVAIVCLQHYLQTARLAANSFIYSTGLFMRDKLRPLFEAVINLVVSIVLAKQIGIVGVFIGTCVSGLATYFWREPYMLFKEYFQSGSAEYWWIQLKWFVLTVAMCAGMYALFTLLPGGVVWLLVRFVLAAIIPNGIILLFTFRSQEFRYVLGFVGKKFLGKFKK